MRGWLQYMTSLRKRPGLRDLANVWFERPMEHVEHFRTGIQAVPALPADASFGRVLHEGLMFLSGKCVISFLAERVVA